MNLVEILSKIRQIDENISDFEFELWKQTLS